jgi:hypothetical protein
MDQPQPTERIERKKFARRAEPENPLRAAVESGDLESIRQQLICRGLSIALAPWLVIALEEWREQQQIIADHEAEAADLTRLEEEQRILRRFAPPSIEEAERQSHRARELDSKISRARYWAGFVSCAKMYVPYVETYFAGLLFDGTAPEKMPSGASSPPKTLNACPKGVDIRRPSSMAELGQFARGPRRRARIVVPAGLQKRSVVDVDRMARSITVRAATVDEDSRSVEAVIATETPVAVYDSMGRGGIVDEILLASGARLPAQMPLLSDHYRSLDSVLGSVRNIRRDGTQIVGRLHFARHEEAERAWALVRDGHQRDVSVGYHVNQFVDIPAGETRAVNGRSFTAGARTLRISTTWTPKETSLVAIGADAASGIRSAMETTTMPRILSDRADNLFQVVQPIVQRGGQSLKFRDFAVHAMRHLSMPEPENDRDVIRAAFSSAEISETFDAIVGSAILRGFEAEPDTTAEWVREVPAINFRPSELFTLDKGTRLDRLARGDAAESADYGLDKTTWQIARFAKTFVVDEQDMADGMTLGAILMGSEQLGAAARRVRPDLIYSLLFSNPAMHDGTALFHADHSNIGTGAGSAMGAAGLGAGIGAIGNQTYQDVDGDPIHVNHQAAVLVVPPDLVEVARRTVVNTVLGDGGDLVVRQESRLGTAGVLDPDSETLYTGTSTNWLLAARSAAIPSIIVGGLQGKLTPTIRRTKLDAGRWGWAWDIVLDIGAAAADWRGVYWADGA